MAKKEKMAEEAVAVPPAPATVDTNSSPAARNGVAEEASFEKTANDMKAVLDAQPKVRVLVALESGEKLGEFLPVNINGYRLNVPKGVYVDVPQTVADIIAESFNIYEQNSASAMRADRDEKTVSALT